MACLERLADELRRKSVLKGNPVMITSVGMRSSDRVMTLLLPQLEFYHLYSSSTLNICIFYETEITANTLSR